METYPLDQEKTYNSADLLTLEGESGPETRKIGEWLNVDPVRIHRMVVREKVLKVDQMEVFAPLVSKLSDRSLRQIRSSWQECRPQKTP